MQPRRATSYSIEGRPWPPHNPHIGKWRGMAMVILHFFFWLEGQASYYVEDKQWPPGSSLLRDGSNGHGHTLSPLKTRRAYLLFYRGQAMVTSQPTIGKWRQVAMVLLLLFLWLEGQTSYYVEDKPWPPHNSLLGDGGNDHGHTLSLLKPRRADFLF